jgi:hypothetical protein
MTVGDVEGVLVGAVLFATVGDSDGDLDGDFATVGVIVPILSWNIY